MLRNKVDREARYRVELTEPLEVTIKSGNQDSQNISARLVDISCGGAKLRVSHEVSLNSRLSFRIESDGLKTPIDVAADICWTRVAVGPDWWLGCSFNPRIPEEMVRELAVIGMVERRGTKRHEIKIDVSASFEAGNQRIPVQIISLSQGGFCLRTAEQVPPNSRVLLRVMIADQRDSESSERLISAKSRWMIESEEKFVIGCEFADSASYVSLMRLTKRDTKPKRQPLWKKLLGMAT